MASEQGRTELERLRRRSAGALSRCRIARQKDSGLNPLDCWESTLERVCALRDNDSGRFSAGAMMAFPDAVIRTGHLSALVGEVACSFPETGANAAELELALGRLAACSLAWLSDLERTGAASR